MKNLFERLDQNNQHHQSSFLEVSGWSAECSTMKFYPPSLLEEHPLSVISKSEDGELLGHAAITGIDRAQEKTLARIGGLAINKNNYGQGIATELIKYLIAEANQDIADLDNYYAYVHGGSLKPFGLNGFDVVGKRDPASETGCNIIVSRPA